MLIFELQHLFDKSINKKKITETNIKKKLQKPKLIVNESKQLHNKNLAHPYLNHLYELQVVTVIPVILGYVINTEDLQPRELLIIIIIAIRSPMRWPAWLQKEREFECMISRKSNQAERAVFWSFRCMLSMWGMMFTLLEIPSTLMGGYENGLMMFPRLDSQTAADSYTAPLLSNKWNDYKTKQDGSPSAIRNMSGCI